MADVGGLDPFYIVVGVFLVAVVYIAIRHRGSKQAVVEVKVSKPEYLIDPEPEPTRSGVPSPAKPSGVLDMALFESLEKQRNLFLDWASRTKTALDSLQQDVQQMQTVLGKLLSGLGTAPRLEGNGTEQVAVPQPAPALKPGGFLKPPERRQQIV